MNDVNELRLVGVLDGIETFVSLSGDTYAFILGGKTVQIEKALSSRPEFWAAPNKNAEAEKFDDLQDAFHEAELSVKSRMMINIFLAGTNVIVSKLRRFNEHPFRAIDGRGLTVPEENTVFAALVANNA